MTMKLTEEQRTHLEERLKEERARLLQDIERYTGEERGEEERDQDGDLSVVPFHPADRGTDTMDEELAATNASRQTDELREIEDALERLYSTPEKFGVCAIGGETIPFERLDIVPWARTCVQHQSRAAST